MIGRDRESGARGLDCRAAPRAIWSLAMTMRVVCIALALQILQVAQIDAAPADPDAAGHLERGIAAYRARAFDRAMEELLAANRQAPELVEPYRWIALTEAEIDDCASALLNVEAFLARVPGADPRVAELVALRERCQSTGSVAVESSPSGAAIRVDRGPVLGITPVSRLAMRVGRHTITVEKTGFEPASREVDVHALAADRAWFVLAATPTPSVAQRWWFWVGVGVGVVGLTALALEARHPGDPGFPAVTCTSAGCQP